MWYVLFCDKNQCGGSIKVVQILNGNNIGINFKVLSSISKMYLYQYCFYAIEYINGIALCDQLHLMCCEVWMTLNRLASNSFLVIEWMITAVKAIKSFDLIAWAGITKGSCRVPTGKLHSWERLTHNEATILGQTEQVQKSPFSLRTTGVGSLNSLALFSTWRRRWTGRGFATSSGKMTCLLRRLVIENFPQFWRARRAQGLLMVLIIIFDCMHVQLNVWEIVSRREREFEGVNATFTRFVESASETSVL